MARLAGHRSSGRNHLQADKRYHLGCKEGTETDPLWRDRKIHYP